MIQSFEAEAQNTERNLYFVKSAKRLAQVRLHHDVTGYAGYVIHAAGKVQAVFVVIGAGRFLPIFQGFGGADDRAMGIANGDSADVDGNFVPGLVMQETDGLRWLRCFDRASQWAILVAELAARLIALQQGFSDAGVADDFVALAAGDAFGAIAPEDNFLLHVDDTEASGQAVEDAGTDFGFMKFGHEWTAENSAGLWGHRQKSTGTSAAHRRRLRAGSREGSIFQEDGTEVLLEWGWHESAIRKKTSHD
jgi:hypothetical protein